MRNLLCLLGRHAWQVRHPRDATGRSRATRSAGGAAGSATCGTRRGDRAAPSSPVPEQVEASATVDVGGLDPADGALPVRGSVTAHRTCGGTTPDQDHSSARLSHLASYPSAQRASTQTSRGVVGSMVSTAGGGWAHTGSLADVTATSRRNRWSRSGHCERRAGPTAARVVPGTDRPRGGPAARRWDAAAHTGDGTEERDGRVHAKRVASADDRVHRAALGAVVALALLTVCGLVWLWPTGGPASSQGPAAAELDARVVSIDRQDCSVPPVDE